MAVGFLWRVWYSLTVPAALWFLGDSVAYVRNAAHLAADPMRPSGYSLALAVVRPAHSLFVVVILQHALGLVIGLLVYWLLLQALLPHWLAAAAGALPVLDGLTVGLEHTLLAETLFTLLVVAAIVALPYRPREGSVVRVAVGMFLLGASAGVRSSGLPLGAVALVILLARRAGWRRLTVAAAAWILPLLIYATADQASQGRFALTESSGFFLYGRVAPFADCSRFTPSARERPLCERTPVKQRGSVNSYLFSPDSPLRRAAATQRDANDLGGSFARRVIRHQPWTYLRVVAADLGREVTSRPPGPSYQVPTFQRLPPSAGYAMDAYADRPIRNARIDRDAALRLRAWQESLTVPGVGYFLLLAVGLVGAVVGRDPAGKLWRGWLALPLSLAATLLLLPPALSGNDVRYLAPTLPLAAMSAAIGVHQLRRAHGRSQRAAVPPAAGPAPTATVVPYSPPSAGTSAELRTQRADQQRHAADGAG